MPFEIEEPEPIEASHLMTVRCSGCGAPTLAAVDRLMDARCAPCWVRLTGAGAGAGLGGTPGPVIARWLAESRTEKPRERSQHPAPEITSREPRPDDMAIPDPVQKLAQLAREVSWDVEVSYSRGNGVHGSTGRPTALRHVFAIAFGRHPLSDAQAVATYIRPVSGGAWTWESVWLWGPSLPHFGLCSLADLKEWLREETGPEWYAAVRWRVAEAEVAAEEQIEARKLIKAHFADMQTEAAAIARRSGIAAYVTPEEVREEALRMVCADFGLEIEEEEVRKIVAPVRAKKSEGN